MTSFSPFLIMIHFELIDTIRKMELEHNSIDKKCRICLTTSSTSMIVVSVVSTSSMLIIQIESDRQTEQTLSLCVLQFSLG